MDAGPGDAPTAAADTDPGSRLEPETGAEHGADAAIHQAGARPLDETDAPSEPGVSGSTPSPATFPAASGGPNPGASDPAGAARQALSGIGKRAKIIAAAVAAAVVIAVAAVFALGGQGPSDSQIENDVREKISLITDDEYGTGDDYKLESVKVVSKRKSDLPEGYETLAKNLGITAMYDVAVQVEGANGDATVSASATASYIEVNGSWECQGIEDVDAAYTATRGISKDKLADGASDILATADESLADMYDGAEVKVGKVRFNEKRQTCTAKLTYENGSAFSDASAQVTADFKCSGGSWSLEDANVSKGAGKTSYDKLVGTWTGAFKSTQAAYDKDCYVAEDSTPTLTITSVDPDSLKVTGTFSGLVHYHGRLEAVSDATDGDTTAGPLDFTATLKENTFVGSLGSGSRFGIGADVTFPETSDGTIAIRFGFGTDDDPNAAMLSVRTEHEYNAGYSIPFTGIWTDTYALTKSDG